jgi:hypothetical protein
MPLAHLSVTVLAIRALAISNWQLGIADGVNCPAMWALKTLAMAEFPSSMHSEVHDWSSPTLRGPSGGTAAAQRRRTQRPPLSKNQSP